LEDKAIGENYQWIQIAQDKEDHCQSDPAIKSLRYSHKSSPKLRKTELT
jgi:hypothetical protein